MTLILALFTAFSAHASDASSLGSSLASYSSTHDVCTDPYGCKAIMIAAHDEAVVQLAGFGDSPSDLLLSAVSIVRDSYAQEGRTLTYEEILAVLANL